jgi:hypothetical protein
MYQSRETLLKKSYKAYALKTQLRVRQHAHWSNQWKTVIR